MNPLTDFNWSVIAQGEETEPSKILGMEPIVGGLLIVVGIIAASVVLGRFLSKRFRMPEVGWRISIVTLCVVVSAILLTNMWPPKFGVDLRGGVTIIGQLKEQKSDTPITVQQLIPQLKERIDPSGVKEITIRALGQDKIEVIIPDVDKEQAERDWERLTSAGHLMFRILAVEHKHGDLVRNARATAMNREFEVLGEPDEDNPNGVVLGSWYLLARVQPDDNEPKNLIKAYKYVPDATNVLRNAQSGELIDISNVPLNYDDQETGRQIFWNWCKDNGIEDVEILVAEPERERENVEGEHLFSVRPDYDEQLNQIIRFRMTTEGGKRMSSLTNKYKPRGSRKYRMGIVLDERLHTAPFINDTIRNEGYIEGAFTKKEITNYVAILNSGKLDVALKDNWISMDQIRSTLGDELKSKGLFAIGLSFSLVVVFMLIYYRFCGIIACSALLANLAFTLAIILAINVNLTLTGLAGLVLTVGMSVDANVLIFERIREELNRGAALRMSIRNGFDRATTTIVDANLTTLITAVILYVIGTDQLRSFAVTLIIGILMCMFTSIFCSRLLFDIAERQKWITKLNMTQLIGNKLLDFVGKRRIAMVVSLVVISVGLVAFVSRGSGILDTDLAGGSTARVEFAEDITRESIVETLNNENIMQNGEAIRYSVTQMEDNERAFKIDSSLAVPDDIDDPDANLARLDEVIAKAFAGRLAMLGMDYDPSKISVVRVRSGNTNQDSNTNGGANPPDSTGDNENSTNQPPTNDEGTESAGNTDGTNNESGDGNSSGDGESSGDGNTTGDGDTTSDDNTSGDDGTSDEEGSGDQDDQALYWNSDGSLNSAQFVSTALPQEEGQEQENNQGEQESSGDSEDQESTDGNTNEQENQETGNTGTVTQDPGTADPNVTDPANTAQEEAPIIPVRDKFEATVDVVFKYETTANSITGALLQASRDIGLPNAIRERDIKVHTTDPDSEAERDTNWTITMTIFGEDVAGQLLAEMKSTLEQEPYFASSSGVGGQIAGETQVKALVAIIASLIGIVAYVWIRFQNVAFGLAAIVALVHDVLVVLGAIAVSYWLQGIFGFLLIQDFRISLSVVAALLTTIGYSLNDTIVVFDRIREVRGKRTDLTAEIVNKSISQTLSRTILTSVTTFVVVFILFVIGGDAIHAFAYSLVIGIIVGTYSSIFVASPTLLWLMSRTPRQQQTTG